MSVAMPPANHYRLDAVQDGLARAATATCFALLASVFIADIVKILHLPAIDLPSCLRLLTDACLLVFYLMISYLALARFTPVAKSVGLLPRIEALLGTFLLFALPFVASRHESIAANLASLLLLLAGDGFALYGLLHLGRSFSLMAEARRLVTNGPYRIVRHPLYVGEGVALFGAFVQFASWQAALLLALQMLFQIRRMLNEEAILRSVFPEYGEYMKTTRRLIPGIW